MPVDYYPGKSLEELQGVLERLQSRQSKGIITEVTAAGVRTVRQAESGGLPAEVQILRVLYSMYVRARGTPEEANFPNPYKQRVTRTRPSYRLSDTGPETWV